MSRDFFPARLRTCPLPDLGNDFSLRAAGLAGSIACAHRVTDRAARDGARPLPEACGQCDLRRELAGRGSARCLRLAVCEPGNLGGRFGVLLGLTLRRANRGMWGAVVLTERTKGQRLMGRLLAVALLAGLLLDGLRRGSSGFGGGWWWSCWPMQLGRDAGSGAGACGDGRDARAGGREAAGSGVPGGAA